MTGLLIQVDQLYYNSINIPSLNPPQKGGYEMQCLRCGREITEGQVFCCACEELMAKHPVNPNTVVTLPERTLRERTVPVRKPQRTEEDTDHLHQTILQLRLWICMLMAALMLCVAFLTWQELTQEKKPAIGQNYNSLLDPTGSAP